MLRNWNSIRRLQKHAIYDFRPLQIQYRLYSQQPNNKKEADKSNDYEQGFEDLLK